jgi:bifunctional non-homologous end joining protein LigD
MTGPGQTFAASNLGHMPERDYPAKRAFDSTPEPEGAVSGNVDPGAAPTGESFVIHQHHATRLHFDLRLEMMNGDLPVLVSWAIPRNLPRDRGDKHLAIHVEDHPIEYGSFSGTIPAGNYGAGEVRIFDSGAYEMLEQEDGKLTFRLKGSRLPGVWHMVRTSRESDKDEWLAFLRELERPEPEPLGIIRPMMATLVDDAFDDDAWIFEPKWDGVRAVATCIDETMLVSRNLRNVTAQYPELQRLHERLVSVEGMVDGEIVAMSGGRPSFEKLQSRINLQNPRDIEQAMKKTPVTFIAFDLLYLDGRWLLEEPLRERKELLEDLVVPNERVQVSTYVEGDGRLLYEAAKQQHLEGVVGKRMDSHYYPGKRSRQWLKVKTTYNADVVIGGWTPGEGSRSKRFGALLVGAYDDGELRFIGAVGTGFSQEMLDEMMEGLEEIRSDENPFGTDPSADRSAWGKPVGDPRWVEPSLVAKVEFRELTSAGRLRAPSFKGLRDDKDPEDCLYGELLPHDVETIHG